MSELRPPNHSNDEQASGWQGQEALSECLGKT